MHAHLTWMQKDIGKLEERKIKHLKELVKEHNDDFEHHVAALNSIKAEDKAALDSEETVFDEHVDRVLEIIE